MSKFLIGLFIKFGKSESLRKAALSLLKDLVSRSDNDIDDAIVKMIEEKNFKSIGFKSFNIVLNCVTFQTYQNLLVLT